MSCNSIQFGNFIIIYNNSSKLSTLLISSSVVKSSDITKLICNKFTTAVFSEHSISLSGGNYQHSTNLNFDVWGKHLYIYILNKSWWEPLPFFWPSISFSISLFNINTMTSQWTRRSADNQGHPRLAWLHYGRGNDPWRMALLQHYSSAQL